MSRQQQFLNVIDRDEAERRFLAAINFRPLGDETIGLAEALGRVLAEDVEARVDVPSFDRSNFDGYAVRAEDTHGADEESPRHLKLIGPSISAGMPSSICISPGTAAPIATGAMLPRGSDAIVMVEHADEEGGEAIIRRSVPAGFGVSFAGGDIAAGETVLRAGETLTSRETGVLAAIGVDRVCVRQRAKVAVISTGDEIIAPGQPMRPGQVYDSNARIIADAVRELGGEPLELGIVADDLSLLREKVTHAIETADAVLLSGGTSKGEGDLSYRVVSELTDPGIVAHGVALKPGKPICLAASRGKPVVILPGFPTSAVFTFHEFVAPVIRKLGGMAAEMRDTVSARLAVKVNSEVGRTEYLLVGLVRSQTPNTTPKASGRRKPPVSPSDTHDSTGTSLVSSPTNFTAFPMGKGSGSVTAFSRADGFVTIGRHEEIIEAESTVEVTLLARDLKPADLVVIGSHCVGLDFLLGELSRRGVSVKFMAVGSTAGLEAARRAECDLAGIHLMDAATGEYNRRFVSPGLTLIRGYGRMQGVVFRKGDPRFQALTANEAIKAAAKSGDDLIMVNRNQGSGTRILIDRQLNGVRPPGYAVQAKSHNAVAAAVAQGRADWGVAIRGVADRASLGFLPLQEEQFDFVTPDSRRSTTIDIFRDLLSESAIRYRLQSLGFTHITSGESTEF